MMSSVRKTLKTPSDQCKTDQFLARFALKITTKSAIYLPIAFRPSLPRKFPRNSREIVGFFRDFVSKNPTKFDFFSVTYQKPCKEGKELAQNIN